MDRTCMYVHEAMQILSASSIACSAPVRYFEEQARGRQSSPISLQISFFASHTEAWVAWLQIQWAPLSTNNQLSD
jgi:hypothetical protein